MIIVKQIRWYQNQKVKITTNPQEKTSPPVTDKEAQI